MIKNYYIIPIFVPHKGCPHDCVFCNQKKITGTSTDIDEVSINLTINEYLSTIDRTNSYVELSFFGGSFTGIPLVYQNTLLAIGHKALLDNRVDALRLSTRPDYISVEILDNLKRYGVKTIELGVQSMDSDVLIASERGHTPQDVVDAATLIKNHGFNLGLQMMIGLPKDDITKDLYTAKRLIELAPDFVRIYPTLVIKDTPMEQMLLNNTYTPLDLEIAVETSKELYKLFIKNKIKVIRIGLQATEQVNLNKDIIAGPFHSAFRELVEASLLNEMLRYIISENYKDGELIKIKISNRDISKLYSNKKKYFYDTLSMHSTNKIIVQQTEALATMTLGFECDKITRFLSIEEYLHKVN